MRLIGLACFAAMTALGALSANAAVIFSNIGPSGTIFSNSGLGIFNEQSPAFGFTSHGNFDVTQIDIGFFSPSAQSAIASLWTYENGGLGTQLGSWSFTGTQTLNPVIPVSITGITNVSVFENETYFLRLASDVGRDLAGPWVWNDQGVGGLLFNPGYVDPAAFISQHGAFAVFGDASGVPEPATWAMMLMGFGFIGGALRMARRSVARAA